MRVGSGWAATFIRIATFASRAQVAGLPPLDLDAEGDTKVVTESLLYQLCHHRFEQLVPG